MSETSAILQLGAEALRQKAQPIDDFTCPKFLSCLQTMQQVMVDSHGVGIAAPQLGVSWQIVLVASRPGPRYPQAPHMPPTFMINPSYEVTDEQQLKDWEGCLSVPGIRALVPRYRAIKVSYQNPQGQACQMALQDFPARVFQHEFDHLQGLVYLDRLDSNQDIVSELEFFKRIAA